MARMNPDDRREAIIEATLEVVRRRGIGGTTVRDVAAELGTSSGLIHHYYASMDELLAQAFARVAGDDLDAVVAAVRAEVTPLDQLRAVLDAYSRSEDPDGMQVWLDAWSEAARRPELQQRSRELNEQWQQLLSTLLRTGVESGQFVVTDVDAAAWRILAILDGLLLQVVAHADVITRAQADQWAREAVEREVGISAGSLTQSEGRMSPSSNA
jgi:AcrR family transcriptional regulator